MSGSVISVRIKNSEGKMQDQTELDLHKEKGIVGDMYYGHENRQVLLLNLQTLNEHQYQPGDLREQILVDFAQLQSLEEGSLLKVGDAVLKITFDCHPCRHMAEALGEEPEEFVKKMMGKRGMLATVYDSGRVRSGDEVRVVSE
jgi:MOSC domain-containing protein YiiM